MSAVSEVFESCFQLLLTKGHYYGSSLRNICLQITPNWPEIWEMTIHLNSRTWSPCQSFFALRLSIFSNLRNGLIFQFYNRFSIFHSLENRFNSWSTLDVFMEQNFMFKRSLRILEILKLQMARIGLNLIVLRFDWKYRSLLIETAKLV